MTRDIVYLTIIAFLWLHGGLGWAAWDEANKQLRLTRTGKAIVVAFFPFVSLVSSIGMGLQWFSFNILRPISEWRRSRSTG